MGKIIKIVVLVLIVSLIVMWCIPGEVQSYESPEPPPELTTEAYITMYASQYGSDKEILMKVMSCESGGEMNVIGDSGRARNIFQYHTETWDRYAKRYRETFGVEDEFDINSRHDAAKLTAWVFSLGEINRREWTTYVAIKNGGVYKFHSKLLNKDFVVVCK